jgi:hypothetical protein
VWLGLRTPGPSHRPGGRDRSGSVQLGADDDQPSDPKRNEETRPVVVRTSALLPARSIPRTPAKMTMAIAVAGTHDQKRDTIVLQFAVIPVAITRARLAAFTSSGCQDWPFRYRDGGTIGRCRRAGVPTYGSRWPVRHRGGGGSPKYDRNVDAQMSSAACSERPTRPRLRYPGAGPDAPVASRLVKRTMQRKHLAP